MSRETSDHVAAIAARLLRQHRSPAVLSAAGSALSQREPHRPTRGRGILAAIARQTNQARLELERQARRQAHRRASISAQLGCPLTDFQLARQIEIERRILGL